MPDYAPDPKLKFTFGLWTVGNVGRDPFGEPTRERISVRQILDLLGHGRPGGTGWGAFFRWPVAGSLPSPTVVRGG
jgi:hypothetical protein